jgi:hypothetical protein
VSTRTRREGRDAKDEMNHWLQCSVPDINGLKIRKSKVVTIVGPNGLALQGARREGWGTSLVS